MGIQDQICFIKGTRYDADYIRLQGLRDMHLMVPLHLGAMSANPPLVMSAKFISPLKLIILNRTIGLEPFLNLL